MRKYAFILLFLLSPVLLLVSVFSFRDTLKKLEDFPVVISTIEGFNERDQTSNVWIGKIWFRMTNAVHYVKLKGIATEVCVAEEDQNYMRTTLNNKDSVKIYLEDTGYSTAVQVEARNKIIQDKKEWVFETRWFSGSCFGLGIFSLCYGIYEYKKFKRLRKEDTNFSKWYELYNRKKV